MSETKEILKLAQERGLLAAADVEAEGLPRLEKRGDLERVARGIYALPGREITEHHDLPSPPSASAKVGSCACSPRSAFTS
jgi:predicted transcriptional regulator of viral defense system